MDGQTFDFGDGRGPIPAHRHRNGSGWVADEVKIDDRAFVGETAVVFGAVVVEGTAIIGGVGGRVYAAPSSGAK